METAGPSAVVLARALVAATDRLVWNHGGAAVPACWHVVNLIAPASSYFDGCLCAVVAADPLTRRIALYHGDTGFGWQVGDGAVRVAGQLGVEVSVSATLAEVAAGDMLLVAGRFADDACASQQHRDQAAPNPAIGARAPPPTDVPAPINDPTRHLLTPPLGGRCGA